MQASTVLDFVTFCHKNRVFFAKAPGCTGGQGSWPPDVSGLPAVQARVPGCAVEGSAFFPAITPNSP